MSSENEMWPVRATAWELAAFSFRHPMHELARAITSGEWFDAACEIGDALGVILPEDFGKGSPSPSSSIEEVDEDGFFHRLRAEATRLFMGPGEPACSPYEGVWRAKAEGVEPLLFVNPHSVEVERFVKNHGFTRPEGYQRTARPCGYRMRTFASIRHEGDDRFRVVRGVCAIS